MPLGPPVGAQVRYRTIPRETRGEPVPCGPVLCDSRPFGGVIVLERMGSHKTCVMQISLPVRLLTRTVLYAAAVDPLCRIHE